MTIGEVIRVRSVATTRGFRYHQVPTVSFVTPNGHRITFTSVLADIYKVGHRVQVCYLPERPSIAELPGASIFSGRNPTYFIQLLYGGISFPVFSYVLLQILVKIFL